MLGGGRLLWIPCPTGENLDPVGGELDPVGEVAAGGSGRERRRRSVGRRGRASLVAVINIARAYWRFIEAPGGAAMKR
ncbi:hypothetical protein EEB19_07320 [Gordonia sp. OPL2]|nr:hypothetical protein EEB19_07320 [Gordonia sp. OPL2]